MFEFRPRDLLLPYPAAVRQAAKFFDCVEDDFVRHVGGDFDFSNFARQHKVDHAALSLFIRLQTRQNLARAYFQFRQTA